MNNNQDMAAQELTVGEVAELLGLTVRTLHHWDRSGLVSPSGRSASGYRLYSPKDVARLQRVQVYRELRLPLDRIKGLLAGEPTETAATLREQSASVQAEAERLLRLAEGLERLALAQENGISLNLEQRVAAFGDRWDPAWVTVANQRWGQTQQWAESVERGVGREVSEWRELSEVNQAVANRLAAACRAGVPVDSPQAQDLVVDHRKALSQYYAVSAEMHVCLARTYVDDPEFRAYFEGLQPGLAEWLRQAINSNAKGLGVDPTTATWG